VAATAVSMLPCPLITITGTLFPSARSLSSMAMPSMPGMFTSTSSTS
jgi:hypothetical protein